MGIFSKHIKPDSGWFRLFGVGMSWKKANAPMLFSERNGYKKTVVVLGWRFGFLKQLFVNVNKKVYGLAKK